MTRKTTYIYIEHGFNAENLRYGYGKPPDRKELEKVLSFTSIKHLYNFLSNRYPRTLESYSKFCKDIREERFIYNYFQRYTVIKSIVNPIN